MQNSIFGNLASSDGINDQNQMYILNNNKINKHSLNLI